MRLFEIISSGAFVYADENVFEDVVISISGDYMTGWYRQPVHVAQPFNEDNWVAMNDGPIQHGLGNDYPGGLYGADAAALFDAARDYLYAIADVGDDDDA